VTQPRISQLGAHTFASRVTIFAAGFLTSILISRALGPEGRGLYVLAVSTATIAALAGGLGIEPALVRLWAHRRASATQFETAAAIFSVALGIAAGAITWVVYELARSTVFEGVRPLYLAIAVAMIPFWIHGNLLRSLLTLAGHLTTTNVALVIGNLVRAGAILVLYLTVGLTVELVILLFGAMVVIPWALMLASPARPGRIAPPIPWRLIADQLRLGVQIAPFALFLYLNLRLDVFILADYEGAADVGLYSVAALYSELVWLATDSLVQSVKERQANSSLPETAEVTAQATRMNLAIGTAGSLALAAAAPVALGLLFSEGFSGGATAVWALAPAAVAMAAWRTVAVPLVRFERPFVPPLIGVVALAANLVANLILIPPLGLLGAGLSSLASYGCGAGISCALFLRRAQLPARTLVPGRRELRRLFEASRPSSIREQLGFIRDGGVRLRRPRD